MDESEERRNTIFQLATKKMRKKNIEKEYKRRINKKLTRHKKALE